MLWRRARSDAALPCGGIDLSQEESFWPELCRSGGAHRQFKPDLSSLPGSGMEGAAPTQSGKALPQIRQAIAKSAFAQGIEAAPIIGNRQAGGLRSRVVA